MNELGNKIAQKRKDIGMTQIEFADRLNVTRQTVSRWEAGTVMPDIDKVSDIAAVLGVSCDYLLKDGVTEDGGTVTRGVSRLMQDLKGKTVRFTFQDGSADADLYEADCKVIDFEGNWMKIQTVNKKKETLEKLLPVSSILSLEIKKEAD